MCPHRPGLVGCAVVAVLCATLAPRQVEPTTPSRGPGVRNAHGLAFDGRLTVLFGGASERAVVGDTWGWNGRSWQLLCGTGPASRTFPVMVGVPGEGVLLFGGRRVLFGAGLEPSQFLADLWSWDGRTWRALAATGPSGRAEAAGAWDSKRRRLVVFGGYAARDGDIARLGDTWEFGEGRWQQLAPEIAPAPRHGAAAWYDSGLGEVVLFGGNGASGESWSWNGTRWRRLDDRDVPGRYNAAVSAGGERLPVLRFGGWDGSRRRDDTWTWWSGAWTAVFSGASPSPRNHAALAYDSRRDRYVLVGGHDGDRVFGDVWEADDRGWTQRLAVVPRQRVDNSH
ncbi:MAG: hypothetical protein U0Q12_20660 [Vicinamibacterales bacterium]